MNVLPVGSDAASFRAASRATPVKGQPTSPMGMGHEEVEGSCLAAFASSNEAQMPRIYEGVGAIAARTPLVQPPQVAR